jgi:diguanylate cyclase (GGDEF)-like protein
MPDARSAEPSDQTGEAAGNLLRLSPPEVVDLRPPADDPELVRLVTERDRLAAALDRAEAAVDRHRAAQYLHQTYHDLLTGALHRQSGRERLEAEVQRAHRTDASLVIAFVDVDGLKRVNDERGHAEGDALLKAVGQALLTGLRSYDCVVRYGGDEFVCALPDLTLDEAGARFGQVQRLLQETRPEDSLSLGLAVVAPGSTLDETIHLADQNLYERRRARAHPPKPRHGDCGCT